MATSSVEQHGNESAGYRSGTRCTKPYGLGRQKKYERRKTCQEASDSGRCDLRRFYMAGLVRKHGPKSFGKRLIAERLRERGVIPEARRKPTRSIAGRKNDRHATTSQLVGNREDHRSPDIHIEDCRVESGMGCEAKRLIHLSGRSDHFTAEVEHHVLDQHR